jgi:uncharacterized membrane protein
MVHYRGGGLFLFAQRSRAATLDEDKTPAMEKSGKIGKDTLLFLANILLLVLNWISALYSYPRLPENMPLWLNFLGQDIIQSRKSLFFFIYPLTQTLFILAFLCLITFRQSKRSRAKEISVSRNGKKKDWPLDLEKEFVLLSLIFINLIFIHLQTSLILLAHKIGQGVNRFYFFSLFAVLLILIPYYRVKKSFLSKKVKKNDRRD